MTSYTVRRLPALLAAIDSLTKQTYPLVEIVFVAEGPGELAERVQEFVDSTGTANVRVIKNNGPPGLSFARNAGVQHASGDIIAFTDDDAVASVDWAEQIVQTFRSNPDVIGLTGQAIPLWEEDTPWFPEELDWIIGSTRFTGWEDLRPVRNVVGVNMAFRREAFRHCSFSEHLGGGNQNDPMGLKKDLLGDDTLFSLELRAKTNRVILFNPAVRVYNEVPAYRLQPDFVRRRAFWEGCTKAALVRTYGKQIAVELSTELSLLRRIVFGLLPKVLWQLTYEPSVAWKKLALTVTVLFHVAIGYVAGRFPRVGRTIANLYA